jgi:enediyne biosynthesis protein E4
MSRKQRRLWGWSVFSLLVLAGVAWASAKWLATPTTPQGPGRVTGVTDEGEELLPASAPVPRFVARPLGFRHFPGTRTHRLAEDMGSGIAAGDFDGDGDLDLFFVQSGPLDADPAPCEAWRNLGGMHFERVDGPLPALHGMGVAAGDVEGDGDLDLYVTGYGGNALLRNDGGLRFADVTDAAGVRGGGFSSGAVFGDADMDGDLDLYVTRYVVPDESVPRTPSRRGAQSLPASLNPSAFLPAPNLLFLNDGHGVFREAAQELGVDNPTGRGLGAVFADLDLDGVVDLYVANDVSDNALFRGRRGLAFEDQTHPSCTADPLGAMGLALGDPDLDLDLDIFITHWQTEENTLFEKLPERLVFQDASIKTGLGPPGRGRVGWGCDWAEIDNDGRPDLFVVNGSTFEEAADATRLVAQKPQLFWNGGKHFFDLAARGGGPLTEAWVARAMVAADFDDDGRVDWLVGRHGGEALLLRNETEKTGGFLVVDARAGGGNPFAYGARVEVEAGGRKQVQQVGTRVSYLSSGATALHFGLGAARAARVTVRFPSGAVVERKDVAAGTRLIVREVEPRALGSRMDAVGDALRQGQIEQARSLLEGILKDDPGHPGALYRLASLVDRERALDLLDAGQPVEPTSARAWLRRAQILSDPRWTSPQDLELALVAIARARAINPNETGVAVEEGLALLRLGRATEAARLFESGVGNARAQALAALAWLRAGDAAAATRLLGRPPGQGMAHIQDEGDTAQKKLLDRDLIARLLDLGSEPRWTLVPVPLESGAGREAAFEDVDGDGRLDARVGARAALLAGLDVRGTREVAAPAFAPPAPAPYDVEVAARFALEPPARVEADPPGTTAVVEADVDGDGLGDRVVACGGDDPAAPLVWWLLRATPEGRVPVRGSLPHAGFRVGALAAADLDGDGRAEILLAGGGRLPGDVGGVWIARWVGQP